MVEIKNNNLTLFNIDALFQKEHRLKTMSKWDDQKVIEWKTFEEQVKKSLGTEEEPFEGKVPLEKVE